MKIDSPPSSRIPTSKETRVRVDGLEKISAHVWPANGLDEILPRFVLNSAVRRNIRSISSREVCSILSKCFIQLRILTLSLALARRDQRSLLQLRAILHRFRFRSNLAVATSESRKSPREQSRHLFHAIGPQLELRGIFVLGQRREGPAGILCQSSTLNPGLRAQRAGICLACGASDRSTIHRCVARLPRDYHASSHRELAMLPRTPAAFRQTCSHACRAKEHQQVFRGPKSRRSETRRQVPWPLRFRQANNRLSCLLEFFASCETFPSENAQPALRQRAKANSVRHIVVAVRLNIRVSRS